MSSADDVTSRPAAPVTCRLRGESLAAQFARFVLVGVTSNILYAVVFFSLGSLGSFTANVLGIAASTVLANELHRRHTFHAAERVGWFQAQWEAGGLALVGILVGTAALATMHVLFPGSSPLAQAVAVVTVTAVTGALRFLALRGWVF